MAQGSQRLAEKTAGILHCARQLTRRKLEPACEECSKFKLKCAQERPCVNCTKRGFPYTPRLFKPTAFSPCQLKKIKCDKHRQYDNCRKLEYRCQSDEPTSPDTPATPEEIPVSATHINHGTSPATTNFNDTMTIEHLFDFDAFALLEWNFPTLSSASVNLDINNNHPLVFDDFDRSRLEHDLKDIS
jgi:Fungal Zn(2)-Cys(6) binuclear cluster domain